VDGYTTRIELGTAKLLAANDMQNLQLTHCLHMAGALDVINKRRADAGVSAVDYP